LAFPFEASVEEHSGSLPPGERLTVHSLFSTLDDLYGLFAIVETKLRASEYPLCDLEVTPK
jgi:hypothetical protein